MPPDVRVVAFDLMDTVLTDPFRDALRVATGREPAELFALRDPEIYPAFERGEIVEEAYWAHFAERGVEVDPAAFHRVRRAGIGWIEGMDTLLDDLAGTVLRVTASNYPLWVDELTGLLSGRFEWVLASHHLGARKPDADFYLRLAERIGHDPRHIAFLDDRQDNVDGARQVGMQARRFTGVEDVRHWLDELGISRQAGPRRG